MQGRERPAGAGEGGDSQGMVIVATLLCSTMRGARLQERKVNLHALCARWCHKRWMPCMPR